LADIHPHVLSADGTVLIVALHLMKVEQAARAVETPHHHVEYTGGELRRLERAEPEAVATTLDLDRPKTRGAQPHAVEGDAGARTSA
jgi:hypothetical protein